MSSKQHEKPIYKVKESVFGVSCLCSTHTVSILAAILDPQARLSSDDVHCTSPSRVINKLSLIFLEPAPRASVLCHREELVSDPLLLLEHFEILLQRDAIRIVHRHAHDHLLRER